MKFELKTENEKSSKSFSYFFGIVFIITLIIILCDVALKLGIISRNHKIEYNCRLLSVEKSKPYLRNYLGFLIWKVNNKFGNFAGRLLNNS